MIPQIKFFAIFCLFVPGVPQVSVYVSGTAEFPALPSSNLTESDTQAAMTNTHIHLLPGMSQVTFFA